MTFLGFFKKLRAFHSFKGCLYTIFVCLVFTETAIATEKHFPNKATLYQQGFSLLKLGSPAKSFQDSVFSKHVTLMMTSKKEMTLDSCANMDLISDVEHSKSIHKEIASLRSECFSLQWFKNARDPLASFLPDEISENIVRKFPSDIIPSLSEEERADKLSKTIESYFLDQPLTLDQPHLINIKNEQSNKKAQIMWLGRGDFNQDKIEDWLLLGTQVTAKGLPMVSELVVITKLGQSEEPKIIQRQLTYRRSDRSE